MEHLCKFSNNGCETKMMVADITEHEVNCLYKKVLCKFSDNGCETKLMLADITQHEVDCLYRKVTQFQSQDVALRHMHIGHA